MVDALEKIRSVVTEVLDREADVSRVAQSGPWPAFVLESDLWVPRRIYLGRSSPDPFPREFWQLLRSRGSPGGEGPFRDFVRRTSSFADVHQIEYRCLRFPNDRDPEGPQRHILVNGVEEIGVLDRIGLATLPERRLIEAPRPPSEVRDRWAELSRTLSEERRKQRQERDAAEKERERLNERLCQALLSHLARDVFSCPFCRRSSQNYRYLGSHFICWACGRSFFPADLPPGTLPSL
jgi:hypothetical protein